jgi:hypothetical protein
MSLRMGSFNEQLIQKFKGRIHNIQLDDLITKENSKCKPLLVTLLVDADRRTILATKVSQIPAFGKLAKIALKKYGMRQDEHQRYPSYILSYLPIAKHEAFKSERATVAGQEELKSKGNINPPYYPSLA